MNDEAETLGAGAAADELALELLEVELELEDELPQADTATPAVIASATTTTLLLSKCTIDLLHSPVHNSATGQRRRADGRAVVTLVDSGAESYGRGRECGVNIRCVGVNMQ